MRIKITFLGTSSAVPTIRRGLTSIALTREGETLLFDCGEGAQIKMLHTNISPVRISRIFISHLHGDHINGIFGLLQTMDLEGRTEPLHVYGPPGIDKLMNWRQRYLDSIVRYKVEITVVEDGIIYEHPEYTVETCKVDHGVPTFAYSVSEKPRPGRFQVAVARQLGVPEGPMYGQLQRGETIVLPDGTQVAPEQVLGAPRPGRKITYSGDTRPCHNVVELAKDSDVLIHDATFTQEFQQKAFERGHSTAAEAAQVAKAAGVGFLLLTHISARYIDITPILEEAKTIFPRSKVAYDLMVFEVYYKE